MSAERIYGMLQAQDEQQEHADDDSEQDSGEGQGSAALSLEDDGPGAPRTPGGFGQVIDAPEPGDDEEDGDRQDEQARDWQIAAEQAQSVARLAGKMPAGAARSLEASKEVKVDWRELLRRSFSETIPSDYSWTRPNRRHVHAGLYLPGVVCEGAGEVAIAVDCSGSVNARQLGLFEAEIRSIIAGQQPRIVHVLYFDTEVQKAETFTAGQPIKLSPAGGGGTDFRPCFTWLKEHGIQPQTLVFLTDLYGQFPEEAPAYPVIWASTENSRVPFGQVVPMGTA